MRGEPRENREPREHMAEVAGSCRNEKLGKGSEAPELERFWGRGWDENC